MRTAEYGLVVVCDSGCIVVEKLVIDFEGDAPLWLKYVGSRL